jgi:hypothetical protein
MLVTAVAEKSNEPASDRLAELLAERDDLGADYARLSAERNRIRVLEGEEATILAEIGELGRSEVRAIRDWAKNPHGDPPAPLTEERAVAARRLADAQAACAAGRVAISELDAGLAAIHRQQLALEPSITALIFDLLTADYGQCLDELRASLVTARAKAAQAFGLFDAMRAEAQHLQGSGKTDEAREMFARLEHLEKFGLATVGPTEGEIAEEVMRWRARAAALRTGTTQ